MARLPALIDALAAADGRPRRSVDHVAREVREAGLIRTTKRGRGAADMTSIDAAYLMLGLYGAPTPADAKAAAQELASFKNVVPGRVYPELEAIRAAPDLVHALAALIELAPLVAAPTSLADTFMEMSGGARFPELLPKGWTVHLTFERPNASVWLGLVRPDSTEEHGYDEIIFIFDGARPPAPPRAPFVKIKTRVNGGVIRAVHQCLFGAEPGSRLERR